MSTINYTSDQISDSQLRQAFEEDGYDVVTQTTFRGQRGIEARSKTAFNHKTDEKKFVYYVEGSGYEMGYLMGLLAHEKVELMATRFVNKVVASFLHAKDSGKWAEFWRLIVQLCELLADLDLLWQDIPKPLIEEMDGLVDGCHKANQSSRVDRQNILVLNVGIDVILSIVYGNILTKEWIDKTISLESRLEFEKILKEFEKFFEDGALKLGLFCNCFSVSGDATADRSHYFGRDFMFSDAGVFQNTACMTIYNPVLSEGNEARLPMVALTAPGFVGSITAMNTAGVGIGVDMVPSGNNNPLKPGLNSLLLVRHTCHQAASAKQALQCIVDAPRGVSWLYVIADGTNDRAVVAEAGATTMDTSNLPPLRFPPEELKALLPNEKFLHQNVGVEPIKDLSPRWNDYQYPEAFLEYNDKLFEHFKIKYIPSEFGEKGFIKKCPKAYYFAPQREAKDDVLIATNSYITPVMRLYAMLPWTVEVASSKYESIQRRYDELNNYISSEYGKIDAEKAKKIINFQGPHGKYKSHNEDDPVEGAISICDLKRKTITSLYGYYKDEWILITLPKYI